MALELNVAMMRTALVHFIEHSGAVDKGTDLYAFVDDLHFALDHYFEANNIAMQITDQHELHKALELEGYAIMYSGISNSYVNDPDKTGLVVRGFSVQVPEEEEEEDEDSDDEDEEEDSEEEDSDDEDEEEDSEEEDEDEDHEEEEEEEEELDEDEGDEDDDEHGEEDEEVLKQLVAQAKAMESQRKRRRSRAEGSGSSSSHHRHHSRH